MQVTMVDKKSNLVILSITFNPSMTVKEFFDELEKLIEDYAEFEEYEYDISVFSPEGFVIVNVYNRDSELLAYDSKLN